MRKYPREAGANHAGAEKSSYRPGQQRQALRLALIAGAGRHQTNAARRVAALVGVTE